MNQRVARRRMPRMETTDEELETTLAGEALANRKYTAWGRKAEKEGFPVIARLFRAAAEAETIHALAHLSAMDGIKSTPENVAAALDRADHPEFFRQAQAALAHGRDLDDADIYLCPVCGHLQLERPIEPCPTCHLPAEKFSLVS